MPYITKEDAAPLLGTHLEDAGSACQSGGDLNFAISTLLADFLGTRNNSRNVYYADFAQALAALEGAKFELQRRCIAPYEDIKLDPVFHNADPFEKLIERIR